MAIQVKCSSCGQMYKVDDKFAGKHVKCKKCGQVFLIATGAEAPAAMPPTPPKPAAPEPAPPLVGGQEMQFDCPHCKGRVSITSDLQGQAVSCPYCNQVITAPGAAPSPPPSPLEPAPAPPAPVPVTQPPTEKAAPPAPSMEEKAVPPEAQKPEEAPKGGGFKKVLVALGAILVIFVIGLGAMYLHRYLKERDPETHFNRAQEFMKASDHVKAEEAFQKAISLKTDRPYLDAYAGLAELYEKTNRLDKAVEQFEKITEIDTNNLAYHEKLAKLYEKQGRLEDALKEYEETIALDRDDIAPYKVLAAACLRWDDPTKSTPFTEKAMEAFKHILRLEPKNDDAHTEIGLLLQKRGEFDAAADEFKAAAALNDSNARAHYGLGMIYKMKGQAQPALAELEKALGLQENFPDAWLALGEMCLQYAKYDEAIKWCKKAVEAMPKDSKAYQHLGNAYLGKSMLDDAATALQKACDLDPKNGEAKNLLKIAQEQGGKVKAE